MSSTPSQPILMFPLGRKKIGRYELLHPLASGGMATVFAGRFFGIGGFEKLVSVKVIHPHLAGKKDFVEMFLDEARLSAKIHHPNAIEIFEVGEDDGLLFIVAELIHGKNLDEVLTVADRGGDPLSPRLYLSMIAKVCDALHAAHSLTSSDGSPIHLVHRDISPSNILVSYGGHIKLIDFGIAFAKERLSTTRTNVVKGKRGYVAPEQFNRESVDRRTDIFSLGVVLYYLATGRHPFSAETQTQYVFEVLHADPVAPRVFRPDLPLGLETVILKALAKEPNNRHQSAEELGLELRSILSPLGGIADSVDIAGWMARVFAQQILDDKQAFENAAQSLPEAEMTPLPLAYGHSRPRGASSWAVTKLFKKRKSERPIPSTEIVKDLHVRSKSFRSPRWLVFLLVVASFVMVIVVLFSPRVWKASKSPAAFSPTNGTILTEPKEPSGQHDTLPEVADTNAQTGQFGIDTALDTLQETGKVELLLHGLPAQCSVTLDEIPVNVTNGKIEVPGDGKPRQLEVVAKGFLPYRETLAPLTDGELTLNLLPQAGPRQTSTKRKTQVKRSKRGILAQSPYDTQ